MTRVRSLCSALLLSGSIATAASAASSTWMLNVKETDFGGGPTIKFDIDHVLADSEQHPHWEDVTVDGTGITTKTSRDGPEDGNPAPDLGSARLQSSVGTRLQTASGMYR